MIITTRLTIANYNCQLIKLNQITKHNPKQQKMKKIYSLLLASIFFSALHAQSIDLSLKLEKEKNYKFNIHTNTNISQNVMGQDIDVAFSVANEAIFEVEDIDNDEFMLKGHLEDMDLSMNTPQGEKKFSSRSDDEHDQISSALKAIKGKSFGVIMNKSGAIIEVNKIDSLWLSIIDNFNNISGEQQMEVKEQIKESLDGEAIKNDLELFTVIYPTEPVKKGDKWNIVTSLKGDIAGIVSTEYELIDYTNEYAMIEGNATIEPDLTKQPQSTLMDMEYDISGKITSKLKVDRKTGWIVNAVLKREMDGNVHIKQTPGMENGMKISIKVEQDILITN